ncbi:hypothetical protein BCN14_27840 [Salmonella enterica]|nr:hypothetical protein [Salmonella enterica]
MGKILTFTVTPVNGKGTSGAPVSIDTRNATDTRGGDSDTKGAIIDPAVPSEKLSTLKSGTQSITADGKSEAVLTFEVKNAANEAITGLGNNVVFNVAGATVSLSGVSEAPPGTYTVKLTGTQVGTADVTVSVNGVDKGAQIALTAGTPDGAHSVLKANPVSIVANNGDTAAGRSTVTLTLKDTQDNLVTGLTDVALDMGGVTGTALTAVTESPAGSGVYTATLSGTMAGTATLTASAGGAELNGLQAQVTLTPDISMATVTAVTETAGGANADNTSTNTLKAVVKDANGNVVPHATVAWSVTKGIATLDGNTSETDSSGVATMTVKDTMAEMATVSAKVGINTGDSGQSVDTAFSVYPVISSMTVTKNEASADGKEFNLIEVKVTDVSGKSLSGQTVTVTTASTTPPTEAIIPQLPAITDVNGLTTVKVVDTKMESPEITAKVGGTIADARQTRTVTTDFSPYAKIESLLMNATNKEPGKTCKVPCEVTLSAKVVDAKNRPLPNVTVAISGSVTGTTGSVEATSGPDGLVNAIKAYTMGGEEDLALTTGNGIHSIPSSPVPVDIMPEMTVQSILVSPTGKPVPETYGATTIPSDITIPTDLPKGMAIKTKACKAVLTWTLTDSLTRDHELQVSAELEGNFSADGFCHLTDKLDLIPQSALDNYMIGVKDFSTTVLPAGANVTWAKAFSPNWIGGETSWIASTTPFTGDNAKNWLNTEVGTFVGYPATNGVYMSGDTRYIVFYKHRATVVTVKAVPFTVEAAVPGPVFTTVH